MSHTATVDQALKSLRYSIACNSKRADRAARIALDHVARERDRALRRLTVVGTWALIAALGLLCMCCAPSPKLTVAPEPPPSRNVVEQWASAVQIYAACPIVPELPSVKVPVPRGSGAIIGKRSILTAYHVAELMPDSTCTLVARTYNGKEYALALDIGSKDEDVARMRIDGAFDLVPPVSLGARPRMGEHVCVVSATPQRKRRCGDVQWPADDPYSAGDVTHDAHTEPGNSGAGVYDESGFLVGVLTHWQPCMTGGSCGGRFSSLAGRPWTMAGAL